MSKNLRTVIKYLVVLLFFAGMSCEKVIDNPLFTIGSESIFRINEQYTTADGRYNFQITELNDSRCPEGAECFWQGEVSLKGEWIEGKVKTAVELHSVMKDLQKVPDGFTIEIIDVKPIPKLGADSKPEDLVVTLLIQKK
jgi:hypothetical protein